MYSYIYINMCLKTCIHACVLIYVYIYNIADINDNIDININIFVLYNMTYAIYIPWTFYNIIWSYIYMSMKIYIHMYIFRLRPCRRPLFGSRRFVA